MEVQKDKKDDNLKLESLSTIQKILMLQNLLKEMSSIKGIFNDTINKMLQKLDNNCYTFFKNKLNMKEIFEYCLAYKPEEQKDFELIENSKIYLNHMYQPLCDFYFLIRNDNSLMLKIIELSDPLTYSELSDFFVHFLYGNILNNSFVEDELMIIIYLLLEQLILKNFPDDINEKNKNFPIDYLNNTFLFYVFKALTRKIDMRNFLYNILNDIILRIESYRMALSVDISIVNRFLKNRDRKQFHSLIKNAGSLKKEEVHRKKKNFTKMNKNTGYLKTNTGGNIFLKRANKIVLGDSFRANNNNNEELLSINDKLTQAYSLPVDNKLAKVNFNDDANKRKFEKRKTDVKIDEQNNNKKSFESKKSGLDVSITNSLANSLLNKIKEEENETQDSTLNLKGKTKLVRKEKNKNKTNNNDEGKSEQEIEIGKFFEENSITIKAIKDQISKCKSDKDINNININSAMNEYLNILIKQIENGDEDKVDNNKKEFKNQNSKDQYFESIKEDVEKDNKNDKEIYSTSLIVEELYSILKIKNKDSFINLIYKIRFNHRIVTKIILEIIKKIKDNFISSPYSLKCISKIINILLNIKYNKKSKHKLSNYKLYMFELNFLIGNIILPIIINPEFNGVVTTDVISEMTNDNLKILASILEKMIKGSLFNKRKDPYMTIYNKFIIETMPQLFELVEIIENHFEIPGNIKNLVDSHSINDLTKRNINYDYFKEKPNENINYQDICFSWQNLYLILRIVSMHKNVFIDENKNAEQKLILKKFLDHENEYIDYFLNSLKDKKFIFMYLTKDFYREDFDKTITSITKDNFVSIIPKSNDDLITAFKKCLVEMLNYVNKIEIENFYDLTEKKDEKTFKPKKYKNQKNDVAKNNNLLFKGLLGSLTKSLLKLSTADKSEDADFRKVLFPQIRNNIVLEMNFNTDNDISQRIIFCTNYLNLYFRNIPKKYKDNNYSLLFDELIKETKKNMEYLKTNVIFEFYKKLKDAEKLNMIITNLYLKIKNLKKQKCIEYLYNKLLLPIKFKIDRDERNIIYNIKYEKESKNSSSKETNVLDYLKRKNQPIRNMIEEFPDFHDFEDEYDNILDIEEQSNTPEAINDYFDSMRNLVKNEKILQKFDKDEKIEILNDLENYVLTQLYDKLFPFESTKSDIFFYNKCCRLSFIKPENIVKEKRIINENLWKQAIEYIESMNDKLTPSDKIKCFIKAVSILENSINFSSGKDNLGIDDSLQVLIYVMIKSRPTNIISNSKYCEMYLNSELSKSELGINFSRLSLAITAIKDMKYSDLIDVSEEQFGKDEIEKDENDNDNDNENEDKKE